MSTTLTNSASQVNLASYASGNPFSVGNGVYIAGIYGDASQMWTLSNAGSITGGTEAGSYGGAPGLSGVSMASGGTLTNMAGGTIRGGFGGDGAYGEAGGDGGNGVVIEAFGTVVNEAGATIRGGKGGNGFGEGLPGYGIMLAAGGIVTNAGTIAGGSNFGIGGNTVGIVFQGSANSTLVNSGTIEGSAGKGPTTQAVQFGDGNDRLILYSGSVLTGGANGGGGSNTLELDGTAAGSIAGIDSAITNFQTIVVDGGTNWTATDTTLAGVSTLIVNGNLSLSGKYGPKLPGALSGNGTLTLQGGVTTIADGGPVRVANLTLADSAALNANENLAYAGKLTEEAGTKVSVRAGNRLAVTGTIAGSGAINIGASSILKIAGVAGAAESIAFAAKMGKLTLINPKRFRAKITRFVAGDQIDIANANFAFNKSETLTFFENAKKTEGTLTLTNGANTVALHLFGQHIAQGFHISGDGHGGTVITYKPPAAHALDHLASGRGG